MKIRTWKFKLGPFTWTRSKFKPTQVPTDLPAYRVDNRFPHQPGWYNLGGQAWYWTGSEWVR